MTERRLIALVLVVAGVWVQWGPGFALIVAGVGYAMAGVELAPRVAAVRAAGGRGWARVRAVAAAVPRQTVSVTLVALAAATLPTAAYLAAGMWAALAVFGALSLTYGTHLGWEK
jgi:hypothetical protein